MKRPKITANVLLTICAFVIVGVLSFAGGTQYQKNRKVVKKTNAAATDGTFGTGANGFGRRGGRAGARPVQGTVSAITNDSMTITTTNGDKTVSLKSNPTVSNGSAKGAITDIKSGDTVLVFGTTGSDGTITASRIALNPVAGSQMAPPAGSDTGQLQ